MSRGFDESAVTVAADRRRWPAAYPDTAGHELLTIGEMAREFGTTPRALRFYESKGLLSPQRQGAARLYGRAERERLALVLKAKRLGFTLGEIRQMLGAERRRVRRLTISRRQCFDQIKLLEAAKARDRGRARRIAAHLFVVLRPHRRRRRLTATLLHLAPDAAYIRARDSLPGDTQPCRATRRLSTTCSSC